MNTLLTITLLFSVKNFISCAYVKEENIKYIFYSQTNLNGTLLNNDDATNVDLVKQVFDTKLPTVIILHGWRDYKDNPNTYIRDAIFENEDTNVIKVDWTKYSNELYLIAKNCVPEVGQIAANFLATIVAELNYSYDNITIVGFSLGAHVAGNIGRLIRDSTNGQISLIIGLDPAGPLISKSDTDYIVDASDAQYVQIIHTNAGVAGLSAATGDSDFYPNGGKSQLGCGLELGCNHDRAYKYYAESIGSGNKFVAQECHDYNQYTSGECTGGKTLMGGLNVDRTIYGQYYLTTNSEAPYGRG